MTYLLLSILASVALFILFRWFGANGTNTRHAIMVNYATASATGLIVFQPTRTWFTEPWFPFAAALGMFFYLIFRIMARTTQENGVAVASVVNKMSVIIPVLVGLLYFREEFNTWKIAGIAAGMAAVVLSTHGSASRGSWHWPLILFLGSGIIDTSLKLFQAGPVNDAAFPMLCSTLFGFAFLTALGHHLFTPDKKISQRSILGGLLLGVVNFGTVYFILKALSLPGWESSVVYPINNVGVVALSTLAAAIIFREKPNTTGYISLALAALAILLLYHA